MNDRKPELPPAVEAALQELAPDERAGLAAAFTFVQEHASPAPAVDEERARKVRAALLRHVDPARPPERRGRVRQREREPIRRRARQLTALALAAVVVAVSVYALRPRVVAPGPGETARVELRDGSTVTLDADARLRVPVWFGRLSRHVSLRGRAYFAVQPGEQAFAVVTANATATALGTRFAVEAQPERTDVVVEEGTVRVAARRDGVTAVRVEAGEASSVPRGLAPSAPVAADATSRMAWRLEALSFVNVPLERIVRELERRYRTEIRLAAGERIRDRSLTYITQQPLPLETVLRDLCQSTGLHFRLTAQGYEIVPKAGP